MHAENVLALEHADLVAVASTRRDRCAQAAAHLGVRACAYEELIAADDIDAVVVAARSIDHAQWGAAVLAAGKHLFLEKPGATSLADHDRLLAAAAAAPDAVVQVGYHRRFDARWREARRHVEAGAIGRPLAVLGVARDVRTPEPEDPVPAGGFLLDMASHDYDAACWLLGAEPVEAVASRQTAVFPELEPLSDLDNASVVVRFEGGTFASLHISRTCPWGHDVRAEVVGDEGSLFVGEPPPAPVSTRAHAAGFPQDYRTLFRDAYVEELRAFVDACRGEGEGGPGLVEDRRAVAVGVAARAAALDGLPRVVGADWPWP